MKAFNLSKFTSFNIYLILQYLDQVINFLAGKMQTPATPFIQKSQQTSIFKFNWKTRKKA